MLVMISIDQDTLDHAMFNGLTLEQFWQCVHLSESKLELKAAIESTIMLQKVVDKFSIR